MKKSSDKSPVRRHNTAKHINSDSEAVSSSSSFTDSDSTCSLMTPSMEFPDRISFRKMDLSEAGPSGVVLASSSTNRDITELTCSELTRSELTRSESSETGNFTELIASESSEIENLSTPTGIDGIIARMKKSLALGRRGDKTSPVRRYKRSDAAKDIKYDAADDLSVSTSLLMTRSLDSNRTSFRVGGVDDGEMDRIYRYIGVSRPEDFAISSDAWEASQKRSSSDVINGFKSLDLDCHKVQAQGLSEAGPSGVVVAFKSMNRDIAELMPSESSHIDAVAVGGRIMGVRPPVLKLNPADKEVVDGGTVENRRRIGGGIKGVRPFVLNLPPADKEVVDGGTVENKRGIGGGIKGVRPSVLNLPPPNKEVVDGGTVENKRGIGGGIKGVRPSVLKPPPVMKLPPIDLPGSSWDFLAHFAPEGETVRRPSSTSSSENGCDENVGIEETGDMFIELEDTTDEACSFTTNECDSSSTVSNTSPIYVSGGSINTFWQKGQLLRRGSFGSVYEAISEDGDFFAVKEVSLLDQGSQAQECIQQLEGEIALLSQLQHQNIVRYRGSTKDGSNLYIFLELVSQGSLLKLYQRYQLRESVVSLYTRQILDGLKYLHDKGFIHRDIKCANILVDANGAVKLADFGLAKVSKLNDTKSYKGTPFWMAPEVINPKRNDEYGSPADIWSLGCTVLEMSTGQIPYSDLESVQAHNRIERGMLPDIPDTLSLDTRDFIVTCLKKNPEERPTAAELLNHPFVRRPLPSSSSGGSLSPLIRRSG